MPGRSSVVGRHGGKEVTFHGEREHVIVVLNPWLGSAQFYWDVCVCVCGGVGKKLGTGVKGGSQKRRGPPTN